MLLLYIEGSVEARLDTTLPLAHHLDHICLCCQRACLFWLFGIPGESQKFRFEVLPDSETCLLKRYLTTFIQHLGEFSRGPLIEIVEEWRLAIIRRHNAEMNGGAGIKILRFKKETDIPLHISFFQQK